MGKAWFGHGPLSSFSKCFGVPSAAVGGGHERALALLLVLLARTVGGAFADILVPLSLAFEAVENCPDRLLTRGIAGGDVEELFGGSKALTS